MDSMQGLAVATELTAKRVAAKRTMLLAMACALLIADFARAADRSAQTRHAVESADLGSRTQAPRPAHGGDVRLAGPFWLELVVAKGSLTVYVTDRAGAPVDTSDGKGTATAHTDGKGTRIELRPAGGERLSGKGRLRLKRSTVVFVTAHLRGEKPHRAVFRPLERVAGDDGR
jgi:hypothetical protein